MRQIISIEIYHLERFLEAVEGIIRHQVDPVVLQVEADEGEFRKGETGDLGDVVVLEVQVREAAELEDGSLRNGVELAVLDGELLQTPFQTLEAPISEALQVRVRDLELRDPGALAEHFRGQRRDVRVEVVDAQGVDGIGDEAEHLRHHIQGHHRAFHEDAVVIVVARAPRILLPRRAHHSLLRRRKRQQRRQRHRHRCQHPPSRRHP